MQDTRFLYRSFQYSIPTLFFLYLSHLHCQLVIQNTLCRKYNVNIIIHSLHFLLKGFWQIFRQN